MDFNECLFTKIKKGTYIIVVNEPDNSHCPAMVKISAADNSMYAEAMTDSVYIGKTSKQLLLCISYSMNYHSKSDYVKIEPDKFTKIEVDYTYEVHNGSRRVNKVILNQTEINPPVSI